MEFSFFMLKPDAIKRNLSECIYEMLKDNNLSYEILGRKSLTVDEIKKIYYLNINKNFFNDFIGYMLSDEVEYGLVIDDNAIQRLNDLVGGTISKNIETIRGRFWVEDWWPGCIANIIHSSYDKRRAIGESLMFIEKCYLCNLNCFSEEEINKESMEFNKESSSHLTLLLDK